MKEKSLLFLQETAKTLFEIFVFTILCSLILQKLFLPYKAFVAYKA